MNVAKRTLVQFFRDSRANGAPLDRPMLWGFFFFDPSRAKLEKVRPVLAARGLRYVDIFDGDDDVLWLHVEEEREHTVASLLARCDELDALAIEYDLRSFDGFDVGNIDGSILHP